MTTDDETLDNEVDENDDGVSGDELVKNLRKQVRDANKRAKDVDDLRSQLAARDRQDAFRDAGIDPSNTQHGYFMRGYDGEATADAIRAAAEAAGFLATRTADVSDAELEGHAAVQAVSAGANSTDNTRQAQINREMAEAAEKVAAQGPQAVQQAVMEVANRHNLPNAWQTQ